MPSPLLGHLKTAANVHGRHRRVGSSMVEPSSPECLGRFQHEAHMQKLWGGKAVGGGASDARRGSGRLLTAAWDWGYGSWCSPVRCFVLLRGDNGTKGRHIEVARCLRNRDLLCMYILYICSWFSNKNHSEVFFTPGPVHVDFMCFVLKWTLNWQPEESLTESTIRFANNPESILTWTPQTWLFPLLRDLLILVWSWRVIGLLFISKENVLKSGYAWKR